MQKLLMDVVNWSYPVNVLSVHAVLSVISCRAMRWWRG